MPHFIMFVGLPASGKSTWRADMPLSGYDQLSTDDLIDTHAASVGLTYDEVFQSYIDTAESRFWNALADCVANKRHFVVDRTNLAPKARRRILSKLSKDYTVTAIVFLPPQDSVDVVEHRRRLAARPGKTIPQHILTSMQNNFVMPTKDEGFDQILTFDLWGRAVV